jgi:hypothetical protein
MGGKRIAEQVRRALIAAARMAPVAVVIDAGGWACSSDCTTELYCPSEQSFPHGEGTS